MMNVIYRLIFSFNSSFEKYEDMAQSLRTLKIDTSQKQTDQTRSISTFLWAL